MALYHRARSALLRADPDSSVRLREESIRFEDRYGKLKPLYEPIIAELTS